MRALATILCILPIIAFAQRDERLTMSLELASDPDAFVGHRIVLLCVEADVMQGLCPAIDELGRRLGNVIVDFNAMSHADHVHVMSRCLDSQLPTCTLTIAGSFRVSAYGGLFLDNPQLRFFRTAP